jgi:hypothetical protein
VSIETFENLTPRVHPAAFIHSGAFLIGSVEVGEEASVWPAAVLRGDHGAIRIGARTSIQDGCVSHATHNQSETVIGAECTVGHRVLPRCGRAGDSWTKVSSAIVHFGLTCAPGTRGDRQGEGLDRSLGPKLRGSCSPVPARAPNVYSRSFALTFRLRFRERCYFPPRGKQAGRQLTVQLRRRGASCGKFLLCQAWCSLF